MEAYRIKEAANITGLSQQVIYKYLDIFSDFFNGRVKSVDGVTALTEEGIHPFGEPCSCCQESFGEITPR